MPDSQRKRYYILWGGVPPGSFGAYGWPGGLSSEDEALKIAEKVSKAGQCTAIVVEALWVCEANKEARVA